MMVARVPIDQHLPESVLKDVRYVERELARNADRRVIRLVRVPVLEFSAAVNKAMAKSKGLAFAPWAPTCCGYAVDMTTAGVPEIVAVHPGNNDNVAHQPGGIERGVQG